MSITVINCELFVRISQSVLECFFDVRIQHIQDEFTVHTYEEHGRFALKNVEFFSLRSMH